MNRIFSDAQEGQVVARFQGGASVISLATEFGCSQGTITATLRRHKIAPRSRKENASRAKVLSAEAEEAVVSGYQQGASLEALAQKFACSPVTVRNTLIRRGVPRRGMGRAAKPVALTKVCTVCSKELPRSEFYAHGSRSSECRQCTGLKYMARYDEDTNGFRTKRQEFFRTRQTGWTPEMVSRAWMEQQGLCAICSVPLTKGRGPTAVHADHDHASGATRGLLCGHCNRGLGFFRDSPKALQAAVTYLAKFGG